MVVKESTSYHEIQCVAFNHGTQYKSDNVLSAYSLGDLCHNKQRNMFYFTKASGDRSASFSMHCSGGNHQDIKEACKVMGKMLLEDFDDKVSFANIIKYWRRMRTNVIKLTKKVTFLICDGNLLGRELKK